MEGRLLERYLAPRQMKTVSQWARDHRVLSSESSALAGKFRAKPYQIEPMDALDDPEVRSVTFVAPSQVGGKTEIGLNWFGRNAHMHPGPMLAVQPTLAMAKTLSEERFDPMFRDSPALKEMMTVSGAVPGSKGKGNRVRYKRGPGWVITAIGARSAAELSMRPIRDGWFDEPDRYPANVGKEGSVIEIGDARRRSYEEGKRLITGSPVWEDLSNSIWVFHQQSSGGEWQVPCPHCNHEQPLMFGGVNEAFGLKWDKDDPEGSVQYLCAACATLIPERWKGAMNVAGRYVHARPQMRSHRSFHFEAVASELMRWSEIVHIFRSARGIPDKLQTFDNTVRAVPYRVPGETVAADSLIARRHKKQLAGCPEWVVVLTISVDVQDNRLEVAWLGWGPGQRCWMKIARIEGDTSNIHSVVWKDLDKLIAQTVPREGGGQLRARIVGVDVGHRAEVVSEFVRRRRHLNVRAIRGVDNDAATEPVTRARKANKYGIEYWRMSNGLTKRALFSRLARLHTPGPGYIEFDFSMTDEMLEQFTAEKPVRENGRLIYRKIADRRNEAIDLWDMGYSALWMAGPAVRTKLEKLEVELEKAAAAESDPETDATPAPTPAAPVMKSRRKKRARRKGWV